MRLTADFWVAAYIARLAQADIPAFVVAHGDDTSGMVMVKLNTLDGQARLFHRMHDLMTDETRWQEMLSGSEGDIDAALAKQRAMDRDLWVIEVEDRHGRHLLDSGGL
ncbi:DUF1491 family protein [Phaeobacter sp. J2-8]|uniref:DUF1491 family protein n=1 Tax=Phaeobacter sp. J2-8 TaxID=2931394 RepID=UPI001FD35761|nr:DUF1491 family protein [Phaeobacter sp. J2-8]MCJ7871218.1 DUF1491 family protein [Phaeobacter sp. J2-8]